MGTRPAILALADGSVFKGVSVGVEGEAQGEVVFNTSITGYQEILTDPSYCGQIVTLTYPHVGNVGVNHLDEEAPTPFAAGLIVRSLSPSSSWRGELSLSDYLIQHKIVAISEIDTRCLTRLLRVKGAQNGCIMAGNLDEEKAIKAARVCPSLAGTDLAKVVSVSKPYDWLEGTWAGEKSFRKLKKQPYRVVAYDYGIKRNILRMLADRGCEVTVLPAKAPAKEALSYKPDGIFLSNGPGDPEACGYAILAIQELFKTDIPIFGICLGHQLIALASGAKTVKMKFGHHGANHPVLCLKDQKVWITSQNHGFAVDEPSLPSCLTITHRSLFDGTIQGIAHVDKPVFGFQGHPEASPGPHDAAGLFDEFIDLMTPSPYPLPHKHGGEGD